jgi:hypothetical protein
MVRHIPVLRALDPGRHRWNRGDWIGIAGVIVGVTGVIVAVLADKEPPPRSDLTVSAVDIRQASIPATANDGKGAEVKGSVIDVIIKNAGASSSLITGADFIFRKAQQMENCTQVGGPLKISALYDVKVPVGPPKREPPFSLYREMQYEVRSNTHERFAFKVGPEVIRDGDWPWLYQVEIYLRYDGSQSLFVATANLMESAEYDWIFQQYLPPNRECLGRNAALMQEMIESKGIHSPELVAFAKQIRNHLDTSPRSASATTLPTRDTSLPTPEELYGAEAGAACRHEHKTWSEVFNQLFEKYGSHAAFPGPGENSDGDRYAAVHGLLTDCLARFGVPPPSY